MRYLRMASLALVLLNPWSSAWVQAQTEVQTVIPPDKMLAQTSDEILSVLRARQQELRQHPKELRGLVEKILVPHVDLALLARFVLGRHWREITQEQRQRFTYAFKDMLIRFYATSMLEYLDYKVRFLPLHLEAGERIAVVRAQFSRNNKTVEVNFRVALRGGEWKAFDVTIDNISIVTNYRVSFDEVIRKEGIEALLKKMDSWNQNGKPPAK